MRKIQIQRFIDKILKIVNADFNILVGFWKFDDPDTVAETHIWIDKSRSKGVLMWLNRSAFRKNSRLYCNYQKATLLHELGHLFTNSCRNGRREYRAHKWAYDVAIYMGLYDVAHILKKMVTHDWKYFHKNMKYYRAYLIAKNQQFIK